MYYLSKSEEKALVQATKTVLKSVLQEVQRIECKYCRSKDIEFYGHSKGIKQYYCNSCHRKFVANGALPGMKTSTDIIAGALNCYYGGMSLYNIVNNIKQQTNKDFTEVGIKNWINRFTETALSKTSGLHPNVGPVWIVNECELDVGDKVCYWDVIDVNTSFLLATHLTKDRTMDDASQVLGKAVWTAGKDPEIVVTDLLDVYIEGIKNVFGHAVQHITPNNYESSDLSRRKMKRWNSLTRRRIEILRRLDSPAKSELLLDGFVFDHNYLRPRDDLEGSTPAEKAGIQSPYKNWTDVITKSWTPVESHSAETLKDRHYRVITDKRNLPDISQSASEGQTENEKR